MWETNIGCKQPSKVSEGFGPALTHPTQASYSLLRHAFGGGCVLSRRNPCKAGSNEDRPCRWPAIYCPRAFLVRTRGGVDLRIAQRRACRRRRRRCFLRDWPFVVRVAVVQDSLPPI